MKQFFLLGASSVYGVGGDNGGWGELLKQYLHQKMYGTDGIGEKYEIFNFAKSGATVQFVLDTFPEQLKHYGRDGEITSIVSVGGNNSKAVNEPTNYVSSVEEYIQQMGSLIGFLKLQSNKVFVVSNGYVNESKTNPKISPFDISSSFFTNDRRIEFQKALEELCSVEEVAFIDSGVNIGLWQDKYLYKDGLHPNANGHELLFESIRGQLAL